MARRRLNENNEDTEIDMTPMLDVVFIMLIFFIVTASFVKGSGVEVERPTATTAVPQKLVSMLVGVTGDEKVWIDREEVELSSVRSVVEKVRAENPQGTIVVQADTKANAGTVLRVMKAIQEAGVPEVSISTTIAP